MAKNPFAGLIDALDGSRFEAHNAKAVMAWHEGLGEFVAAVARKMTRDGNELGENFDLAAGPRELAQGLGSIFSRYSAHTEEATNSFNRAHADDIRSVTEPRANEQKWDIGANQD